VEALQVGGQAAAGFGELPADALQVEIWIPPDKADLARKTIEEAQDRHKDRGALWTCASCREENDGGFELCWNCQSPRESGTA